MKIAIVGSHPLTWEQAPLDDPSWIIWGFSRRNYGKLTRPVENPGDLWFELHHEKNFRQYDIDCKGYSQWLLANPKRMTRATFPHKLLLERFGPYFFTYGQISWMLAYAILQEPETIGLFGIECEGNYAPQKAEMWHFVQVARDLGIEVIAYDSPEIKILEHPKLYAFS
jgi:hypothetical protein